jgi:hypothetical protein
VLGRVDGGAGDGELEVGGIDLGLAVASAAGRRFCLRAGGSSVETGEEHQ